MGVKTYRVNLDPADHYTAGVLAAKEGMTRSALYRGIFKRHLEAIVRVDKAYLQKIPKTISDIPAGHVIVHNRVRPRKHLGTGGFRAWTQEPAANLIVCDCSWAGELQAHYRTEMKKRKQKKGGK